MTVLPIRESLRAANRKVPAPERAAILVVEDEPLIRLAVCDHLEHVGFRVFEAGSVAEAMRVLKTVNGAVQLIFSDIQLGGSENGIDLARRVHEVRPDLRIALTSGNPALVDEARRFGEAATVFVKPYDIEKLGCMFHALMSAGNDP